MASIENRSRFMVTVTNRNDLTKTFPHNATNAVRAYIEQLRGMGFKQLSKRDLTSVPRVLSDTFSKFAARWASSVSAGPASSWWASSVFISRSYCCNRSMHRPSQRWTSSWPWGLGWSVIASVFHG